MKRKIINLLLIVGFCSCFYFAATADGMVAFIPTFIAICIGVYSVYYNTKQLGKK